MSENIESNTELVCQIEALLFSSGRTMSVDELARLCRTTEHHVGQAINIIRKNYDLATTSLVLLEEKNTCRLGVKEKFLPLVRSIVAETELSRTVLETLAVVAWRAPVLQSDVITIRTNKAYDHLRELEDAGFIERKKSGRTLLIKLTEKFFKYFELSREMLQKHLGKIKEESSLAEKLELRQRDTKLDTFRNDEHNVQETNSSVQSSLTRLTEVVDKNDEESVEEQEKHP